MRFSGFVLVVFPTHSPMLGVVMARRIPLWFLLVAALVSFVACRQPQPTYVRDTDVKGLDDAAMGTGLDRRDLERLFNENMASMTSSRWFNDMARTSGPRPTAASCRSKTRPQSISRTR